MGCNVMLCCVVTQQAVVAPCPCLFCPRLVVYDQEVDWQREKELYVAAVSSHMNSAPSGGGTVLHTATCPTTLVL